MRKILKTMLSAVIVCITAVVVSICAYAETEDVELRILLSKTTNGAWGQSLTFDKNAFDWSRITPDSVITVEFELEGEWNGSGAPIELVFQNYSTADPPIWAKIPPFECDETSASFRYDEMEAAYGSGDFSTVDAVHVGDCGIVMKATKFTITNCSVVEVTTTETTTEATTEATTAEAVTEASTTAATTAAANNNNSESDGIPLIPIVIAAVVVAVIVVVIIIIRKSRKDFY